MRRAERLLGDRYSTANTDVLAIKGKEEPRNEETKEIITTHWPIRFLD